MGSRKIVVRPNRDKYLSESGNQQVDPLEFRIPLVLLVIGLISLFVSALVLEGPAEAVGSILGAFIVLLVQIPLTILALYILASILGISYGNLWSAILKLAAITIFVEGLAFAGMMLGFPFLSMAILIIVSWFLFSLLFQLDVWETFYSLLGLWIISRPINWLITLLLDRVREG